MDVVPHDHLSRAQRLALPLSLFGTGATLATLAATSSGHARGVWIAAAQLGLAAALGTRRALPTQVLVRAVGWLTLMVSGSVVLALAPSGGHAQAVAIASTIAAATAAGLWHGRALLHTREAHTPFAPARFRGPFLGAATVAFVTALLTTPLGLGALQFGFYAQGLAVLGLTAAMVAAATLVLRMRSAGVFLGAITSTIAATLAATTANTPGDAVAFALLAIPGVLLALPVLLARLAPEDSASARPAVQTASRNAVRVETSSSAVADDAHDLDLAYEAAGNAGRRTAAR